MLEQKNYDRVRANYEDKRDKNVRKASQKRRCHKAGRRKAHQGQDEDEVENSTTKGPIGHTVELSMRSKIVEVEALADSQILICNLKMVKDVAEGMSRIILQLATPSPQVALATSNDKTKILAIEVVIEAITEAVTEAVTEAALEVISEGSSSSHGI